MAAVAKGHEPRITSTVSSDWSRTVGANPWRAIWSTSTPTGSASSWWCTRKSSSATRRPTS